MTARTLLPPPMHGWDGAHREPLAERRHGARVPVSLAMEVLVDERWHPCRVVEVSTTGMMFELDGTLADRESHVVARYDLQVSASRILGVLARPVWRHGLVQAARFVALPDGTQQALADLVRASAPASNDVERLELAEAADARARLRIVA